VRPTLVKRIVLALAVLWLLAWGLVGLGEGVAPAWIALYVLAVAAFVALGAWGERARWLPLLLAILLTALLGVASAFLVPVVVGGLIVVAAILLPPDRPEVGL
jgi:hypothetical protein